MCRNWRHYLVITNRHLCSGDYLTQIRRVCTLKPGGLILREKDLSHADYLELARQVKAICDAAGVPFFIHSDLRAGAALGCGNIHMSIQTLRALRAGDGEALHGGSFPADGAAFPEQLLSVSCHSLEEAVEARALGADRIILGTIYETECKKGLKGRGVSFVAEVCRAISLPVYAIGGVTPARMPELLAAGAAGGCMMSGFMQLTEDALSALKK